MKPQDSPSVSGKQPTGNRGVPGLSGKQIPAWIAEMDAEPEHLGLCYFAGSRGLVKIGFSKDVDRRLDEIRCRFLLDSIELLAVARGHRYRESYYHHIFAEHALGHEWFTRAPEIEAEIARLGGVA